MSVNSPGVINEFVGESDLIREDPDGGVYADYLIRMKYHQDLKRFQLSLTSPSGFRGDSVGFCRIGNPTLLLVIDWTACKAGVVPRCPRPLYDHRDWKLLDVMPETVNKVVMADGGNLLFRVSGTYVYGHRNPSVKVFDDVSFPRAPWIETGLTLKVDESKLDDTLIEAMNGAGRVSTTTTRLTNNYPALVGVGGFFGK